MSATTYKATVDFATEPTTIKCDCGSCDWRGVAADLADIEDCSLTPGDASPAGRCPECDSLAYVIRTDPVEALRTIIAALRDHPEAKVGNSKVHFAMSKALAAVLS